MPDSVQYTGYLRDEEDIDELIASSIGFNFEDFVVQGDVPETFNIEKIMPGRSDQFRMNSCAGFGMAHAAEVAWWLANGSWRQFAPHWSYRRGQEACGIRGDRGCTINGVVRAAKERGLLPEDVEQDGKLEFPYPKDDYGFEYPKTSYDIAKHRCVGYSAVLRSYRACVQFLAGGQGGIVIGGDWGNWSPDQDGVCDTFRSGGGGHARAYVDRVRKRGKVCLLEVNSHYKTYGVNGYAYHTEEFVEAQFAAGLVAIGISDISLGAGDKPKQRKPRRWVNLVD